MMDAVGSGMIAVGALLLVLAAYGVIVLPDALSRQHAATKAGTMALAMACLGTLIVTNDATWTWRLLAILVFLLATLPVASHMLARAAVRESDLPAARLAALAGESPREPEGQSTSDVLE